MTEFRHLALRTGLTLNVALAGSPGAPPVVLLHGFPESHRTWRALAPLLSDDFFLIMPDQRGYGASDRPQRVRDYRTRHLVDDVFALATALSIERFSLVGHDWGGAVAWAAAMRGDPRLERLAILNAPHPALFQKSLVENAEQRAASGYVRLLRSRLAEKGIAAMGLDRFFDRVIGDNAGAARILEADRRQYLAEWSQPGALTAMLNWYRAARLFVPPTALTLPVPDRLLQRVPGIAIPTLVVWGMRDPALLPVQLDGLDRLVDDLAIVRLPEAGHFIPWEAPGEVALALRAFLSRDGAARAGRA